MPKIGKDKIIFQVKGYDKKPFLKGVYYDVFVNAKGLFTTTLDKLDVDFITSMGLESRLRRNNKDRLGYFSSHTKEGLRREVKNVLDLCYSREKVSECLVIRYAIKSTCAFGVSKSGEIVPNLGWDLDGDLYSGWSGGTHPVHASNPSPLSTSFFVKVCYKRVFKYNDGKEVQEYEYLTPFGSSSLREAGYNLRYLEGLVSICPPEDSKLKETPYTEERAKVFVDMFKGLCRIAYQVSKLTNTEAIDLLTENGGFSLNEFNEV